MDAPMPDLKFEPVDLAQIAANTFEQLEMSARKADVTLQLDAKPAMVEADRQMMDELLYNLSLIHIYLPSKTWSCITAASMRSKTST